MMRLHGQGRFSNVGYSMVEKDGKQGLQIQTESKPYAPPTVRPIHSHRWFRLQQRAFQYGARITFLDFGSYRSELRSDVIIGSQYALDSEYYHPFTPTSNWFIAPRGAGNSVQSYVYSGDTQIATYRTPPDPWRYGCGIRVRNHGRVKIGIRGRL